MSNEEYLNNLQNKIAKIELEKAQLQNNSLKLGSFSEGNNDGILQYQLDVSDVLAKIKHLLNEDIVIFTEEGIEKWSENPNPQNKTLTEFGVEKIMQILEAYVNKHILFGKYIEEEIKWKMFDFCNEFNDYVENNTELIFNYVKPKTYFDYYEKYNLLCQERYGESLTDDELWDECFKDSDEEMGKKVSHFPLLFNEVVALVHNSFTRAEGGIERKGARERVQVIDSQSRYFDNEQVKQGGLFSRK